MVLHEKDTESNLVIEVDYTLTPYAPNIVLFNKETEESMYPYFDNHKVKGRIVLMFANVAARAYTLVIEQPNIPSNCDSILELTVKTHSSSKELEKLLTNHLKGF